MPKKKVEFSEQYFKSLDYVHMSDKERRETLANFLQFQKWVMSFDLKRDLSQVDMASELDIPPANLNHYINGKRLPEADNRKALVNKFGNIINDIVGHPHELPDDPMLKELVEDWKYLSDDERKYLRNWAKDHKIAWDERLPKAQQAVSN